jgi:hypothetical protein
MFRTFLLFNCSSLRVSAFEAGQVTCCVIGDNWIVNWSMCFSLTLCSFQLGRTVSVLGSVKLSSLKVSLFKCRIVIFLLTKKKLVKIQL